MDNDVTLFNKRADNGRLPMGRKKNKKKIKWFPGYDLHITVGIFLVLGMLLIAKGCN